MSHRFKVVQGGPYPHFITMSIVRWLPVFTAGSHFKIVVDSFEHLRQTRGLLIHAYIIMPTHVHAILTTSADDLSALIRDFKKFTARRIYEQFESEGNDLMTWLFRKAAERDSDRQFRVWQDEFHPEVVYTEEFFHQKADYIHNNALRKGLVGDPMHWYYSSAAEFAEMEPGPLRVDPLEW